MPHQMCDNESPVVDVYTRILMILMVYVWCVLTDVEKEAKKIKKESREKIDDTIDKLNQVCGLVWLMSVMH